MGFSAASFSQLKILQDHDCEVFWRALSDLEEAIDVPLPRLLRIVARNFFTIMKIEIILATGVSRAPVSHPRVAWWAFAHRER
jgi:hypothetical protein